MQRQTPEVGRHLAQSRTVPRTGRRRIPCDSDCAPSARRLAHPGRLLRASRRRRSGTFILESAEYGGTWSRYSFIGVNSMAQLRSNNGQADWLGKVPVGVPVTGDVVEVAHATLKTLKAPHVEGLPNLTSGLVGTVGWDAIRHWNRPCAPKLRTRPASLRPCLPWPPISPWSTTYPVRYGSSPMR